MNRQLGGNRGETALWYSRMTKTIALPSIFPGFTTLSFHNFP